ncbi:hypothetical protein ACHAWF_013375 [Thalassiosira exigua]
MHRREEQPQDPFSAPL